MVRLHLRRLFSFHNAATSGLFRRLVEDFIRQAAAVPADGLGVPIPEKQGQIHIKVFRQPHPSQGLRLCPEHPSFLGAGQQLAGKAGGLIEKHQIPVTIFPVAPVDEPAGDKACLLYTSRCV